MSRGETQVDEATTQAGLLVEAAQRQQQQTQMAVERLEAMTQGLDQIVRQEIRNAFAEEFQMLGAASQRAAEALRSVRRVASMRIALWAVAVTAACSAVPVAVAWVALPSRADLAQVRRDRDELAAGVTRLREEGGGVDLRRCGAEGRLCVRVERSGPAFGAHADYLIVAGY